MTTTTDHKGTTVGVRATVRGQLLGVRDLRGRELRDDGSRWAGTSVKVWAAGETLDLLLADGVTINGERAEVERGERVMVEATIDLRMQGYDLKASIVGLQRLPAAK